MNIFEKISDRKLLTIDKLTIGMWSKPERKSGDSKYEINTVPLLHHGAYVFHVLFDFPVNSNEFGTHK